MKGQKISRREARENILKILFQRNFRDVKTEEIAKWLQDDYIKGVLEGIEENQEEIDRIIERKAKGWRLERLASVDRNILRLGIYEIIYTDLPPEIAINEAIELCKKYSTEHSHIFINGILDSVWKECKRKSSKN